YMASSYDANGSYNANIGFTYTVAPTSMTLPDISAILPSGIKEYYDATPMEEYLEFYGLEIKGMSESAFITMATSTTTNWDAVELSGSRGFSIWVSMDNQTPTNQLSSMSATQTAKNVKAARPFTIGYEPLKYLGK
ncbi:MAG: hypothetical protein IE916_04020, partial [Epsilonproteobacteria bacterium]|nr:hypothetical protein [Campylobacterota bacterium]